MATGGQIIDLVLELLEESVTTPVFWSRAELFVHLNDGLMELNLISAKYQSEQPFAPTATTFQTTPAGVIAILHIAQNSLMVRKRSLEKMDRENFKWMNEVSPTTSNRFKKWGPVGLNNFFLAPRLQAPGPSVTLTTLDIPGTVGEATTIPLDQEYTDALRDYVFHMARFKEGGAEFQQSIAAYEDFRKRCGDLAQRKLSENYLLWSKEPNADTGSGNYSTPPRSLA